MTFGEINTEAAVLTKETLTKFFDELWSRPPDVCGTTKPHIVNRRSEGWTACLNCGLPMWVSVGSEGRITVSLRPPGEDA